mmetsp:Transcript_13053/g.24380  ORF Transcript_13053/g.24380 Transcript_13053/m.24380 type:complete len:575 (+) Transcript_13053:1115-2839(+)
MWFLTSLLRRTLFSMKCFLCFVSISGSVSIGMYRSTVVSKGETLNAGLGTTKSLEALVSSKVTVYLGMRSTVRQGESIFIMQPREERRTPTKPPASRPPSKGLAPHLPRPRPRSSDNAFKSLLRNYGLEDYYDRLEALDINLGKLSKLSDSEIAELHVSLPILPEHQEKFTNMVSLLKQVSATNEDKQLIRSVSPKNRLRLERVKTNRTLSHEVLPPIVVTPTSARSTDASFSSAESKVSKEVSVNISTPVDADQSKLLQELEEARLKIKQLEETLQAKGGLLYTPSEESKIDSSPQSVQSETIESLAFSENEDKLQLNRDELGLSYDSWKMRSTLVNLDIEEMCRCLAKAVRKHIQTSLQIRTNFCNEIPDFFEDFTRTQSSLIYSDSLPPMPELAVKSFEEAFNDPDAKAGIAPDVNSIYNFSKNVIVRCNMEREVSIACLVYLERLVSRTGFRVTEVNWKRLLFTALVISSKTWDDESFENHHFVRVFTMYTLRQINQMECVFLTLIDYNLVLRGGDYAKYYFILRTYAEQKHRSFPVKALDVDTVRRLQNATKAETALKDLYREPLHKTS